MSAQEDLQWPTHSLFGKLLEAGSPSLGRSWGPNQIAFLVANLAIGLAELTGPTGSCWAFLLWLLSALTIGGARASLYFAITRHAESRRRYPRLVAVISVLSTVHWLWTVWLYVGSELTDTIGMLLISFVMLSLAATRVWTRSPVASGAYVAALWAGLSLRAYQVDLVSPEVIIAGDVIAGVITWLGILAARQPKASLAHGIEADRMFAKMTEVKETLEQRVDDTASILEQRSNFFAGASHDFKQRLHAMKLMGYSALAEVPQEHPAHATLIRMSAEMQELEHYFNEVLDFARVEAIDTKPQRQVIPLQRLMQKVDLHFEAVAATRNVRMHVRPTGLLVETDPAMLQRILENLVSNALKFTRSGVLVAARKRGDFVMLEVWDQGPGVSDELRARIFDAFHEDASAAADGQRGSGLGLTVVKRFADRLRHPVTIQSRPAKGTVFRVQLPAARS
ncbi:HAMP domain-containing sensor histidine kinase [Variovorax sp. KK3]|uniref:sensor histidine kinase n=1 Tax=Variovorax sp. KK3 TaxID=1855728 RepID=UPI00097C1B10|nr:HAMP domain-containing sensor histidine kinase [Variovorax sp. KK3]